jgi:hypothetical protein
MEGHTPVYNIGIMRVIFIAFYIIGTGKNNTQHSWLVHNAQCILWYSNLTHFSHADTSADKQNIFGRWFQDHFKTFPVFAAF